ncbi:hypothetical protein K488DRAFT_74067 [Vararia minispora EC-137]|uniref:Uncharacterized protein n=1 Tax=Vararia minispora EC-137 TaxID=1314806 RepID=A0ACB8Q8C0_9AGAM|nr:hypothetical protein K488DRAFT_74067 [Vararia minispora EC-137]
MTQRTPAIASDEGIVIWNETLTGFVIAPTASIKFELFAQNRKREQRLIGECSASAQMFDPTATQGKYERVSLHLSAARMDQRRMSPAHERFSIAPSLSVPDEIRPSIHPPSHVSESQVPHQPAEYLSAPEPAPTVAPGLLPPEDSPDGQRFGFPSPVAIPAAEPPLTASVIVNVSQLISSAVGAVNAQANFWETLLGHVKSVTAILDKASHVHSYASMAWSVLSVIPRVSRSCSTALGPGSSLSDDIDDSAAD